MKIAVTLFGFWFVTTPLTAQPRHTYLAPMPVALAATDVDLATFDMPEAIWTEEGERIEFIYQLPSELVGTQRELIRMVKSGMTAGGFVEFTSPDWTAICHCTERQMVCTIKRAAPGPYASISAQLVEQDLRARFAGDARLAKRLSLSAHFLGDPAGVIVVQLP